MADFYITDGTYLVSHGSAADGTEKDQAKPGQVCVIGSPPGFTGERTPYGGARWHVADCCWVDTRNDQQRREQAIEDVAVARRAAYPPLADLADALYWQTQGDNTKMQAYMVRCAEVKAQIPKVSVE